MRKIVSIFMVLTILLVMMAGCDKKSSKEDTEVYVFIAASLSNVFTELQDMYKESNPEVTILLNADSSGTLKEQIKEGAECDIFFSAAEKQMVQLSQEGYIKKESIIDMLENKVVLIKPKNKETAVTSFETIPKARSIALAGEDVPVGAYAREILMNLGILSEVNKMQVNEAANVTAVLAAVVEESNEVGVVYATDAASVAEQVDIIAEAPKESLATKVIYPVALVNNNDASQLQIEAAKEFLTFLSTSTAKNVFVKYGFTITN